MSSGKIRAAWHAASLVFIVLALVWTGRGRAESRTIGVYFDAEGTQCHGTIAPGAPGTVYILSKLTAEEPEICGAEFRFVGLPDGWQVFPVPNPDFLVLGDPFGNGASMGFPCLGPPETIVLMYTTAERPCT